MKQIQNQVIYTADPDEPNELPARLKAFGLADRVIIHKNSIELTSNWQNLFGYSGAIELRIMKPRVPIA